MVNKKLAGSILIPQKGGLGARHLSSTIQQARGESTKLFFLNKVPAHSLYNEKELNAIGEAIKDDDWVGISVAAIGLERSRQILRMMRGTSELAEKPVLVGGVQAFVTPGVFYEMGADAVCHHEAEIWLPKALEMLEQGRKIPRGFETDTPKHGLIQPADYDFTKGTHFLLKDGLIHRIESAEEEFRIIPNFMATIMNYQLWVMTDRRCRFECTYCLNRFLKTFDKTHGGAPGRIPTEEVIRQIREIVIKNTIIDSVVFIDDDFFLRFLDGKAVKKDELGLFCDEWKNNINKPFFVYFSPMTFNEGILERLMDAGLRQLNFGYQSGGKAALACYKRPATSRETLISVTRFTAKAVSEGRIEVPAVDFIINSPFESADDMRQTIEAILLLVPPFDAQLHNMRLIPGYSLTETFNIMGRSLNTLPGYKTVLDREYQDHTAHSAWLWPNIEDDRAYYTILQMLMTGLCTEETLGVLKREDVPTWLNLPPGERRGRIDELKTLFESNPRIRFYDRLSMQSNESKCQQASQDSEIIDPSKLTNRPVPAPTNPPSKQWVERIRFEVVPKK